MEPLAYRQLEELERDHWWFRGRRAVCMGLLGRALAQERPLRVLDVGAGAGGFLAPLTQLAERVHFTDLDPSILSSAAARGRAGGPAARGDALPFGDGSFDLVCLFDVLEHIQDHERAAAELARVLRPGGRVFLHVPAHPLLYAENDRVAGHHRRYTRRGLVRLLERAGFEVERATHTNALLFPLIAPAVLGLKLLERLGLVGRGHTNLSWNPPRWVHALCYRVFAAELIASRRVDLPLGHSLAALARRRAS
jgi:SAM-dependent methyltransferase